MLKKRSVRSSIRVRKRCILWNSDFWGHVAVALKLLAAVITCIRPENPDLIMIVIVTYI